MSILLYGCTIWTLKKNPNRNSKIGNTCECCFVISRKKALGAPTPKTVALQTCGSHFTDNLSKMNKTGHPTLSECGVRTFYGGGSVRIETHMRQGKILTSWYSSDQSLQAPSYKLSPIETGKDLGGQPHRGQGVITSTRSAGNNARR